MHSFAMSIGALRTLSLIRLTPLWMASKAIQAIPSENDPKAKVRHAVSDYSEMPSRIQYSLRLTSVI